MNQKKIGIDARLINKTGVGVYIRNLLYYLQKKALPDYQFYIYLIKEDFAKFNFKNSNFVKVEADYPWHTLKEQINFVYILNHDRLDLMHFTYFTYPVLYNRKFVATIHDLTPLLFKTGKASTKNPLIYNFKHFFFRQVMTKEVKNAEVVITPTYAVKEQIVKYFGKKYAGKIYPIYEGVNHELTGSKENQSLNKIFNKDFFIYVGNFYPHKNVERLIEAFSKTDDKISLILLGPDDFFTKRINKLIGDLNQEKRIILYKNPGLEDLVYFYKHALALINPSLSEGFGLPLIEASYYDCPVIASDISVFDEILGDNYVRFNPYDVEDIAEKIRFFIKTRPKFDLKEIKNKYSFEKMTDEILEIYQRTI